MPQQPASFIIMETADKENLMAPDKNSEGKDGSASQLRKSPRKGPETADKTDVEKKVIEEPSEASKQDPAAPSEEENNNKKDDDSNAAANVAKSETPAANEINEKPDPPKRPSDVLPQRPVKRARTAYFIFADEKRPIVQKQHPGEGVAAQAKALGELWSTLTAEEKKVYQEKSALERERVVKETEEWLAAGGVEPDVPLHKSSSPDSLILPVGRIRKICKLDPDVKNFSREAVTLITKAAELFATKLGAETVRVAQIQNRRKLLPDDIAQVCATRSALMFLQPDIQDLVKQQAQENEAVKQNVAASAANTQEERRGGAKPLTDFFSAASKKKT